MVVQVTYMYKVQRKVVWFMAVRKLLAERLTFISAQNYGPRTSTHSNAS